MPDQRLSNLTYTLSQNVDEKTKSVRLVKEGKYFRGSEPMDFSHDLLLNIVKNFKSGKKPVKPTRLPINYNHGMNFGASAEAGVAAGWIEDVTLSDDGWLEITPSWVPRAQKYIEDREYQYLSAEIAMDYPSKNGKTSLGPTLIGAALTNTPFIEGQEGLTLSEQNMEEESMENLEELQTKFDATVAELAEMNTARDTITAEKLSLSEQLVSTKASLASVTAQLSEATTKIATLDADVAKAMDARLAAEAKIMELSTDIRSKEADAFVAKNLAEGRLTPGESEAYKAAYLSNKEVVESLMALRPVITLKEIGFDDATDVQWILADEVEKYRTEHPNVLFADAAIAVTKIHQNPNGGK